MEVDTETPISIDVTSSEMFPDYIDVSLDGSLLERVAWTSASFSFELDPLAAGSYLVNLMFVDAFDNASNWWLRLMW